MDATKSTRKFMIRSGEGKNHLICLVTISLVNWLANFFYFEQFGLYVDDYSRIPKMMDPAYYGGFVEHLKGGATAFIRERPLHDYLIWGFSYIGNAFGGLPGIYFIAYLILTFNGVLTFFLLKRLLDDALFALIGALVFCLYPVSAVKIWLTSSLGIQPALTLLLSALLCYISDRKRSAYLLITVSLFCYESVFPVFLAAPLLKRPWNRDRLPELTKHLLVSGVIFAALFGFEALRSNNRVHQLNIIATLLNSLKNQIAGPVYNLMMHLLIPIKNLINLPARLIFLQLLCFGVLWLIFTRLGQGSVIKKGIENRCEGWERITFRRLIEPAVLKGPFRVGIVMLVLGYAMTFWGNVHSILGFNTRIHTAAVLGAALVIASIGITCTQIFSRIKKTLLSTGILALLISSIIVYDFRIQQEYVLSQDLERIFWSQVLRHCPDISESTLILVEASGISNSAAIQPISWSVSRILDKIYYFPRSWQYSPRVYLCINPKGGHELPISTITSSRYVADLASSGIIPDIEPADAERPIDLANTIVLTSEGGSLRRQLWLHDPDGRSYSLKKMSTITLQDFKQGILYRLLIGNAPKGD